MKIRCSPALLIAATFAATAGQPVSAITLNTGVDNGGIVSDGGNDIYDEWGRFTVNGSSYEGSDSNADPVYPLALQTLGGIAVSGEVRGLLPLGLFNADTDYRVVRWWFVLTNTTPSIVQVSASLGGGVGADSDNVPVGNSGAPLHWILTADDAVAPGDPVLGTVFASATTRVSPGISLGPDSVGAGMNFRIAAGATVSLVYYATARNITGSNAGLSSAADALSDVRNVILDASGNVQASLLANGPAAASTAINHSFADGGLRLRGIKTKTTKNGKVIVTGRATSAFGVDRVDFLVGKLVGKARGTTRWKFSTTPTGRLQVQATDLYGITSKKTRVRF